MPLRIKMISGNTYLYSYESKWTHNGPRHTKQKYLGRFDNFTLADRASIFARDNNTCQLCGSTENLTLDHKISITKGGDNSFDNLWVLCLSCNCSKGDTSLFEIKKSAVGVL